MTKKSREISEFVQSLEMHELNDTQEGMILIGEAELSYGGAVSHNKTYSLCRSNSVCINPSESVCRGAKNTQCTNGYTNGSGSGGRSGASIDGLVIDEGFSGILGI